MRNLLFIIVLSCHVLSAQNFLNGSFETNSFSASTFDMKNSEFNSNMSDITAFGPKGKMDVINSSYSYPAREGSWYIGMQYEKNDLISMKLDAKLIAGKKYILTYWDLAKRDGRKHFDLDFGLSEYSSDFGDKIYDTLTGTCYSHWMKYSLTFTAPNNGEYITIKLTDQDAWIGFDDFSLECAYEDLINLSHDVQACEGQSVILDAFTNGGKYIWQNGSGSSTFTTIESGKYWVRVHAYNCEETDTVNVTFNKYPEINLGNDTSLCDGQSIQLTCDFADGSYLWSDGTRLDNMEVSQQGKYWVEVTNVICTSADTIEIKFKKLPNLDLGSDTAICRGDALTIMLQPSEASYIWNDGSADAIYSISEAGTFSVIAYKDGCTNSDNIEVSVIDFPIPDLGKDTVICDDIPYLLSLPGHLNIQWDDGSYGNSIEVSAEGIVWAENEYLGCISSDTLFVMTRDCNSSLQMPNVFTPNSDGLNDAWKPIYMNLVNELEIKVFDREGRMIYSTNDIEFEWSGMMPDGYPALNAIYYYTMDYAQVGGKRIHEKGNVTLLR